MNVQDLLSYKNSRYKVKTVALLDCQDIPDLEKINEQASTERWPLIPQCSRPVFPANVQNCNNIEAEDVSGAVE